MPINKLYEVVCDNCECGIDNFTGTKASAREQAINTGALMVNDKCFCNKNCFNEFLQTEKEK